MDALFREEIEGEGTLPLNPHTRGPSSKAWKGMMSSLMGTVSTAEARLPQTWEFSNAIVSDQYKESGASRVIFLTTLRKKRDSS